MPAASGAGLGVRLDREAPTPAYLQLRAELARAIVVGRLAPGTALPSERRLSAELGVSRMTVRRAVEALVEERLLERRHGSGTYVRGRPVEQTFDRVLGFTDEARALGFEAGTTLLEVREAPADAAPAAALGVAAGAPLLVVTRLRTADGAPLCVQSAHLAPRYGTLSIDLLRRRESLYATLAEQFGVVPHRARQTVTARPPTDAERRRLDLGPHGPVLALERTSTTAAGEPFEYVRSAYRGDLYRLALDLGPAEGRAADASLAARTASATKEDR